MAAMDYYRNLDASTLDPDFPTFFELLASRQLNDLINPYLRYIVVLYAQQHPQYLLRLATKFDEVYLLVFGLVEFGYLRHWNSSFVEKFYGLKRVNRLPVKTPRTSRFAGEKVDPLRRLTRKQVLGSVFFAVGVPYLREKAQQRYEMLTARYSLKSIEEDRPKENAPLLDHWKFQFDNFLLRWFPKAILLGNTTELLLAATYLFKGSGPYTIADLALNTCYSRISAADHRRNDEVISKGRFKTAKYVLNALGYVLPATLFGIKFLEWWSSSDIASRLANSEAELPPSTSIKNEKEKNFRWKGCPVCKEANPTTPTVLETGVVCCYDCIEAYAQAIPEKSIPKCPATDIVLLQAEFNPELRRWELGGLRRLIT